MSKSDELRYGSLGQAAGLTQHALALRLKKPQSLWRSTRAASVGSTSWNLLQRP